MSAGIESDVPRMVFHNSYNSDTATRDTLESDDGGILDDQGEVEEEEEEDISAPWNIPRSPLDDLFRRTHNSLGSPLKLPVGINSPNNSSEKQLKSSRHF